MVNNWWQRTRKSFCLHALAPAALWNFAALALFAGLSAFAGSAARAQSAAKSYFVYVGTYTSLKSKGIYLYKFHEDTAQFDSLGLAAELANPSFVIANASHTILYAATEMPNSGDAHRGGTISSFAIDPKTGALRFLNKVESGGVDTCHLALDHTGRILFAANYTSGSVASFAIKKDGSIGERTAFDQHSGSSINHARQEGPHTHEVVLSPDNRFLLVPDLGTDRVYIYNVDLARRSFTAHTPAFITVKAGLGPRHLLFSHDGRFAYLICEMGSAVIAFAYNPATGLLTEIQETSTLLDGFTDENTAAEIQLDRAGRHLYASNRGNDSITVFDVDPRKGTLAEAEVVPTKGKGPRHFVLDPPEKHLLVANQYSDDLSLFSIDPRDGKLQPVRQVQGIGAPVCLLFLPVE